VVADFASSPTCRLSSPQILASPRPSCLRLCAGGLTTLITFQFAGQLTDRLGTYPVYLVSSLLVIGVTYGIFLVAPSPPPWAWPWA